MCILIIPRERKTNLNLLQLRNGLETLTQYGSSLLFQGSLGYVRPTVPCEEMDVCVWLHVHPSFHPVCPPPPQHPPIQIKTSEGGGGVGRRQKPPECKAYAIAQIQVAPLKIAFIHQLMVYGLWQKGRRKVSWKNI